MAALDLDLCVHSPPRPDSTPMDRTELSLSNVLWITTAILLIAAHRLARSNVAVAYRQMCDAAEAAR